MARSLRPRKQFLDTALRITSGKTGRETSINIGEGERQLMTTSYPTLIARITLFAALVLSAFGVYAQVPAGGSSARDIPTAVQQSEEQVSKVINAAEDHFRKGKLNLEDNKRDQARDEFDKAVDSILESGLDVRANQRLQGFYLELVERIYREEVPLGRSPVQTNVTELVAQNATSGAAAQQKSEPPQIGFREQKFEPSPLDELSKLVLTDDEKNVSQADVLALEQAKQNVNFAFTINPLIQQYINYYQGRGRSTMESGLRRSGQFMRMARQIFKDVRPPGLMSAIVSNKRPAHPPNILRAWPRVTTATGNWRWPPTTRVPAMLIVEYPERAQQIFGQSIPTLRRKPATTFLISWRQF